MDWEEREFPERRTERYEIVSNGRESERLELRQKQSVPILAELHRKLLIWKEQLLPKHFMADAVNYTLGQWEALTVFTSDGAVPIDNNVSEREMKRVVLNRKNSLFVGNPRGGRTAAILASLTSSCRRHDMDPHLYFMQLLVNLPTWPARDLDAWLRKCLSPVFPPQTVHPSGRPPRAQSPAPISPPPRTCVSHATNIPRE